MSALRIVIYHAGCVDGIVAAWVASRHWDSAALFVPASYGSSPPDVRGCEVLIADFSYPRETLLAMRAAAVSLRVLDHHKTAAADLAGLDFCTFDMERSGAGIAWDELAGGRRPWVVDYAEDRDLWRWKLPDSKAINAYLQVLPKTIDAIDDASRLGRNHLDQQVVPRGHAVLLAQRDYIDGAKRLARPAILAGHTVPVVNAPPWCASEVVGELSEGVPFAAAWFVGSDGRVGYSLRSRGDGADVSEIARRFGGGGHCHAAGFSADATIHTEVTP